MVKLPETRKTPPTAAEVRRWAIEEDSLRNTVRGDHLHEAIADLPEKQRGALKWIGGYIRDRKLSNSDLGKLIKKANGDYYSADSIKQALSGKRASEGVDLSPICEAIEKFRSQVEGSTKLGLAGFIKTRLYDIIVERLQKALRRGRIAFIFGVSQIGKSVCLKQYRLTHNHGETIYVEVPTGGTLPKFLEELKKSLGILDLTSQSELAAAIINAFDDKMMLIVDEAHRALRRHRGPSGLLIFDFLRELYNRKRPGMCICMTNEGRDLFLQGPYRIPLLQLWRRRIAPLQCGDTPFADDLDLYAAAYGLPPASDNPIGIELKIRNNKGKEETKEHVDTSLALQTRVIEKDNLGVWLSLLDDAVEMAKEQRRPMSWGAVLKAYCLHEADGHEIR